MADGRPRWSVLLYYDALGTFQSKINVLVVEQYSSGGSVCVSCMETHEVFLSRDLGPVAHLYLHLIPSHICNTADRFRENQCYISLHPGS